MLAYNHRPPSHDANRLIEQPATVPLTYGHQRLYEFRLEFRPESRQRRICPVSEPSDKGQNLGVSIVAVEDSCAVLMGCLLKHCCSSDGRSLTCRSPLSSLFTCRNAMLHVVLMYRGLKYKSHMVHNDRSGINNVKVKLEYHCKRLPQTSCAHIYRYSKICL